MEYRVRAEWWCLDIGGRRAMSRQRIRVRVQVDGQALRAPHGQALVIAAAFIAFALIPIMLATWGIAQQRADYAGIQALIQQGAQDAAGTLDSASMTSNDPTYDTAAAKAIVRRTLALGLGRFAPRVDGPSTVATLGITPLQGTAAAPATDPTTGVVYHHPTICVTVSAKIGVIEHDGLAFIYTFHACEASVSNL